jgi:acyl dehydratase
MRLEAEGLSFSPVEFVLDDRVHVPSYARALGVDDPVLYSADRARGAGWAGRPVPPGLYAFFLAFPDGVWDVLGIVWGKTLAGEIEIEMAQVADDGQLVRGQAHVEATWERPGSDGSTRQFLRLRSDYVDESGAPLCRWRVTFVEKSDGPAGSETKNDSGVRAAPFDPAVLRPASPPPEALRPGTAIPPHRTGPLDRVAFARMSVASDDPNLVHLDDAVAELAGFPEVIGSGLFVVGAMWEAVRRFAGLDRVFRGSIRQLRPLQLGSALTATGVVESVVPHGGYDVITCAAELVDQDGQAVGRGTFDCLQGGRAA